jgi:hypothetical protein
VAGSDDRFRCKLLARNVLSMKGRACRAAAAELLATDSADRADGIVRRWAPRISNNQQGMANSLLALALDIGHSLLASNYSGHVSRRQEPVDDYGDDYGGRARNSPRYP